MSRAGLLVLSAAMLAAAPAAETRPARLPAQDSAGTPAAR